MREACAYFRSKWFLLTYAFIVFVVKISFVVKFVVDVEEQLLRRGERHDECQRKLIREVVITVLFHVSHSPIMVCTLLKKEGTFKFFLLSILTVFTDQAILLARNIDQLALKENSDDDCFLGD